MTKTATTMLVTMSVTISHNSDSPCPDILGADIYIDNSHSPEDSVWETKVMSQEVSHQVPV